MSRALLLAAALAGGACATTSGAGGGRASTEAADFTLRTTTGETFTLSEHLGQKVIVLDFWATWCTPCMSAMPHLEQLSKQRKGEGLLVVGVAMDGPETVAQVAPMAASHGLTFPIVLDEESRAVSVYNPHRSAPYTVVIGRDGRIAHSREGYNPGDEKALEETVLKLLAPAKPAKPAEAPAEKPAGQPTEAPGATPST